MSSNNKHNRLNSVINLFIILRMCQTLQCDLEYRPVFDMYVGSATGISVVLAYVTII